ncbi:MAG: DAK2 domain-containing protein, partial [Chloroflexota bacterium]|nr:DAK2 domain-containing protein [Chloroflexota bacterium]
MTSRQYPQRIAFADAPGMKDMLMAGTSWLEKHVPVVNALNVFPVPDGDTGTNMFLTMQASVQEMSAVSEHSVAAVMHAAAHGALMGARGNSGVIMSQILRGMARSLAKKETATARDLADAFAEGSATAYKGVIRPVEGTLLTVAKDVAAAAAKTAGEDDDLRHLLDSVVVASRESVAFTPNLLPVLKEAGVVDAGGQGFCIILEGIWHLLRGDDMQAESPAYTETVDLHTPSGEYGYDVQFILQGDRLNIDDVRTKIPSFGDSVLVVGDSHTIKVHVHTKDPGEVLTYGATQGAISKVIVENMQEQYQEYLARQDQEEKVLPEEPLTDTAIVTVVSGDGLVRVFQSLGVHKVIPGGQTMNPSTAEILKAIEGVRADKVI